MSDDKLGSVVAIASGSQLEVYTENGKMLLQQDLGGKMFTSLSAFRTGVRLHPGLKFVACLLAKRVVVVLSMEDGSELLRHTGISLSCCQLCWSPGGTLLAVTSSNGVRLYSVDAGFAEVQHLHAGVTDF